MKTEPTIETDWSDVDGGPRPSGRRDRSDDGTSFWVSALLGALVSIVASFVPFSPVLGGGVAGYLHYGTREEGAKVGAVSGALAAVPLVAVLTLVLGALGFLTVVENAVAGALVFFTLLLFVVGATLLLSAGLSALGGYLGVYVREEMDGGDAEATVRPRE
ncbi:DUF5518 domain-containing protein [Halopelagius longus]|uniref:DUF5518 domain-containing protein n=1 Tax=Halopelagius longus TaxID=1236180 RepID=A0A1H0Y2Z9_9EURY|nr:DUF5518 domain-containing protein [Halopelagius longus]SDQ09537.1 hypothetical protein SAMN05216278_0369 [Halopelagius longus]